MKKTYTTAQGKAISMDSLRLANEEVIAVGNMKVNAKGQALGPGGVPQSTRQQAVNEYYNLHTPVTGAAQRGLAQPQPATIPSADPLIDEQDALLEQQFAPQPPKAPATRKAK